MTELGPEDAKLVTLARAARARSGAAEGAAVRDVAGRTYSASTVRLPSLALSALEAAVAAAVSSGADELVAAAVVTTTDGEPAGLAAARDLGGPAPVFLAGPDGVVRRTFEEPAFRSGFACLVGRPNSGKSTLVNALVGDKVAITSSKPQTTRHAIRGIVHHDDGQLVLVDTPGLHRPRTLLGQRLNDVVRTTWAEVDIIGLCIPADQPVGPGDRFIATEMARITEPSKIAIVTKSDLVPADSLAGQLAAVAELGTQVGLDWAEIVPVSAVTGDRLDLLTDLLLTGLPPGPPLYPAGELTDEPEQTLVAELIREAALEGVQDELPHSIAVAVDEMLARPNRPADRPLLDIHASLYVERDSQKAIVIGRGGSRLRDVGTRARAQVERLLGTPVFLDLQVKVAKEWQRDPKQLGRLGF